MLFRVSKGKAFLGVLVHRKLLLIHPEESAYNTVKPMTQFSLSIRGDPRSTLRSAFDLLESNTLTANEPKEIPGGATITMLPMKGQRALTYDAVPVIEMVLSFSRDVAAGVVGAYLYDKLLARKDGIKLEINRRLTEVESGEITRLIEEEIRTNLPKE